MTCREKQSSFFAFQFRRAHGGNFLGGKNAVAPSLFQPRTLAALATMPAAVMVQEAASIGMMAKKMLISKGRSRSRLMGWGT
jgi:hypothetical protein